MKKRKIGLIAVMMGLLLFLTACQSQQSKKEIQLVTTFYPVYEWTKRIAGDEADVELLVKAGTEVHGFEPSAKDVQKIQESSSFIYLDPNMELWVSDLTKSGVLKEGQALQASQGLVLLSGGEEEDHDHAGEDHHHDLDPHLWLSPYRAKLLVISIRDQLKEAYPAQAQVFERNAAAYLKELDQLEQQYQKELAAYKGASFLTQHTAFQYLAVDYSLRQESVVGLSSEEEPSIQRLKELAEQVKKTGLKRIYFESSTSNKLAQTLASEAGVELGQLHTLEGVSQAELDKGTTYIQLMEENLEQLVTGFKEGGKSTTSAETASQETVANGYFKDQDVKDRSLSDWAGNWQSVYPYLESGHLDQVFDYKAKLKGDKTASAYKDYYRTGYQTDVKDIKIDGNKVTFVTDKGEETYTYKAAGYKILTYEKGNRGVRYQFQAQEANAGRFTYLQFSDHLIAPQKSAHFHLYFGGESQEKLWEELTNWPTYYPASLTAQEIAQEMVAH